MTERTMVERMARGIAGEFLNPDDETYNSDGTTGQAWEDEVDGVIECLLLLYDMPSHIFRHGYRRIHDSRPSSYLDRENDANYRDFFRATVDGIIAEYEEYRAKSRAAEAIGRA